jgi:predicted regulator of Ras-like GTPase activity (Roadblock/LC7/MglB family)
MMFTPEIAAGAGSVAGALLFFGAGFLLAKWKTVSVAVPKKAGTSMASGANVPEAAGSTHHTDSVQRNEVLLENEQLKLANELQKEENRTIVAAAKSRISKLKKQLEQANATMAELKSKLDATSRNLSEEYAEKTSLSEAMQQMKEHFQGQGETEQDRSRLEERNRELSMQAEKYEQQISYIAELEDKNRELRLQTERLDEEFTRLSDLEDVNLELSIRTERFDEQLKDLDALRDENRTLQESLAVLEASKKEIVRLKEENAKLNSLGIVLKESPRPSSLPAAPDGLGGAFQNMVNTLSGEKSSRGVVLADELGLLVAGTGDHTESMAAMAAVFTTVSERMETVFPFGEISQIVIENMDELTITMQPYELASDRLILTALSVGPGPERASVAKLIERSAGVN